MEFMVDVNSNQVKGSFRCSFLDQIKPDRELKRPGLSFCCKKVCWEKISRKSIANIIMYIQMKWKITRHQKQGKIYLIHMEHSIHMNNEFLPYGTLYI